MTWAALCAASYTELQERLAARLHRFAELFPDARSEQARAFVDVVGIALQFTERNMRQVGELEDLDRRVLDAWGTVEAVQHRRRAARARGARKAARTREPKRAERDKRIRALLRRLHEDDCGRRRGDEELRRILRENHDVHVGRAKVAELRPKSATVASLGTERSRRASMLSAPGNTRRRASDAAGP